MRRTLMVLLFSLLGGLLTAYAYAVTVEGSIVFVLLSAPAVFKVATAFGLCAGAIASPLVLFCMKGKDLLIAMPLLIVAVAVLTAGLNLVPSATPLGLPGSFLLAGASCSGGGGTDRRSDEGAGCSCSRMLQGADTVNGSSGFSSKERSPAFSGKVVSPLRLSLPAPAPASSRFFLQLHDRFAMSFTAFATSRPFHK